MKNKNNNIDELLRNSFEDFTSPTTDNVRASMSTKVKKFNFFHFNFSTFNIFYLSAIVLSVVITITSNTLRNNEKTIAIQELPKSETTNTNQEDIQLENDQLENINNTEPEVFEIYNNTPAVKTTDNNNTSTQKNQIVEDTDKEIVNEETANTIIIENKDPQDQKEIIHIESTNSNNNKNNLEISISEQTEEISPKVIVYDTIYTTNKITITDTVRTKIREEIKVKKRRSNRRK